MNFEKTIADNYSTYTDDERGYNYDAWDRTRIEEIRSHDQILHSDPNNITSFDATNLNDLERWALARALRTHQHFDLFFAQCEQLLDSKSTHPALNYAEILETYTEVLAGENRLVQAQDLLKNSHLADVPLDLEGRLSLLSGEENGAHAIFRSLVAEHPDDAELHFEIAENFARHGSANSALDWLKTTREVAMRIKDDALIVDIELLRLEIITNAEIIEE